MIFVESLILGVQHTFEPDHMAAISVLASDPNGRKGNLNKLIWRSSQWALGHSFSLILFSVLALLLKAVAPIEISKYAEIVVGPVMIYLGISAIQRIYSLENIQVHKHNTNHPKISENALHFHSPEGRTIAVNPFARSFWIGMLHGIAGTGGACAVALIMAAENANTALAIILLQSLGILIAMTTYSCVLAFSISRFFERNQVAIKLLNYIFGIISIGVGCLWIFNSLHASL